MLKEYCDLNCFFHNNRLFLIRTKGAKTISFEQFKTCLTSMGKKKGLDADGVFNLVAGKRPGLKGVTVGAFHFSL